MSPRNSPAPALGATNKEKLGCLDLGRERDGFRRIPEGRLPGKGIRRRIWLRQRQRLGGPATR